MSNKKTKKQQILDYLLEGNPLTQWEATIRFRHLRLSSVIFELKKSGYTIETTLAPNADGNGSHAVYALIK